MGQRGDGEPEQGGEGALVHVGLAVLEERLDPEHVRGHVEVATEQGVGLRVVEVGGRVPGEQASRARGEQPGEHREGRGTARGAGPAEAAARRHESVGRGRAMTSPASSASATRARRDGAWSEVKNENGSSSCRPSRSTTTEPSATTSIASAAPRSSARLRDDRPAAKTVAATTIPHPGAITSALATPTPAAANAVRREPGSASGDHPTSIDGDTAAPAGTHRRPRTARAIATRAPSAESSRAALHQVLGRPLERERRAGRERRVDVPTVAEAVQQVRALGPARARELPAVVLALPEEDPGRARRRGARQADLGVRRVVPGRGSGGGGRSLSSPPVRRSRGPTGRRRRRRWWCARRGSPH